MTDTAQGKIQETQVHRYKSTRGIDYQSIPYRLWEKSKELFWDPAKIDFSQDAIDWKQNMTDLERLGVASSARGFMVGEEAVTLDILPLLRVMSDQGRLEDTMYLTMFAMEEAKHVDMFRRWFDAVEFDPQELTMLVQQQAAASGYQQQQRPQNGNGQPQQRRRGLFDGELTRVMQRLDHDQSPEAIIDASLVYNQLVEGIAAIGGYRAWAERFRQLNGKLPGLEKGIGLTQRDERRHIAYGTYLCRRIIAENPDIWEFVERRWTELTGGMGQAQGYGGGAQAQQANGDQPQQQQPVGYGAYGGLAQRRLAALAVARTMKPEDVESDAVDSFVPEELLNA